MLPVIIRSAVMGDEPVIAELSRKTFYDTFVDYNTRENMNKFLEEAYNISKVMEEMSDPAYFFFIAYVDQQPAGYLVLRESDSPIEFQDASTLEISRLYASKPFIGQGIGKHLMEKSIAFAHQKAKEIIWLGVFECNARAISFYQKWGFEKFRQHIFMVGDDPQNDWLMKKELK